MVMLGFILGFLFCAVIAWYYEREARKSADRLHANFLSLVNEMSIRTGGRQIFKDKKAPVGEVIATPDRGEFRIVTPSMAEEEAMERDESDNDGSIDDMDLAHLRRSGLIQ